MFVAIFILAKWIKGMTHYDNAVLQHHVLYILLYKCRSSCRVEILLYVNKHITLTLAMYLISLVTRILVEVLDI